MDAIGRMAAVYIVLLILLRFSGRRALAEITTFDFVLLLVVSEATQQAILGDDFSLTNAFLTISTIVLLDRVFSVLQSRFDWFQKFSEGVPVVLLADGKPVKSRLDKTRITEDEILHAARSSQGLERLDQIKYAVLETSGGISIIPKSS